MIRCFRRLWCEHDYIRRANGKRLWLECANCGRQTPGISQDRVARPDERRRLDALVGMTERRRVA